MYPCWLHAGQDTNPGQHASQPLWHITPKISLVAADAAVGCWGEDGTEHDGAQRLLHVVPAAI